jgi:protein SMG7
MWGHPSQKDWSKAAAYYQQALYLIPDNGNPHNQLAVLATYADDDFNAVYRYFCSLAVLHPFLTARDNLIVLFEKNRIKSEEKPEG